MTSFNQNPNHTGKFLLAVLLAVLLGACARSMNPDIERGSLYEYQEGFPELRMSAIGMFDDNDNPTIVVNADIVKESLIFKQAENNLQANFTVDIQILNLENDNEPVESIQLEKSLSKTTSKTFSNHDVYAIEEQIDVTPGQYEIVVTVIDQNSRKETTRRTQTFIPDPSEDVSNITGIQMLGKDMDDENPAWKTTTTYDVPGNIDSLKFVFQITNNKEEDPLSINAELVRFKSDTSIARSMYSPNYSSTNIQYKGIDYEEREVIQSTDRTFTQPGSIIIEFNFEQQSRGNYRFEVRADDRNGEELFKGRDFGVKSKNYPALKTPKELARPLAYLMNDSEYEKLMDIDNPDSLKKEIDRFWLRNINSEREAGNVLQMYYERVEQANKQFSNFKEGWKTDMGMIYILFGQPWYTDRYFDRVQWLYSYNRNNPERTFTFMRPKLKNEFYPFDYFILQRHRNYYNTEYQQVQLWLSGRILQRNL